MRKIFILLAACFWGAGFVATAQWKPLFNGKDLSGWKTVGGKAPFTAANGEIVGTTKLGESNSFLATARDYGDFRLKFKVMLEAPVNSGVQFRSASKSEYQNGRVHGYQYELDPAPRAWSGGIYDEGRRDWLYTGDLNPKMRKQIPLKTWLDCEVHCKGNEIRTFLNGEPVAHLVDDLSPSGFIALQVHSIGGAADEGKRIRWKDIQINEAPFEFEFYPDLFVVNLMPNTISPQEKANGTRLLFDGKTNNGWRGAYQPAFPQKGWQVKDGELTVLASDGGESTNGGDIVTDSSYDSFVFQFEFKMTPGANSGVKYFVTESENNQGSAIGLEYQVLDDALHPDANQGSIGNRKLASLYDLIPAKQDSRARRPIGEWNRGMIVVNKDGTIRHYLNGYEVLHFERGSQYFKALVAKSKYVDWPNFGMAPEGTILLQDHGNKVSYRSIKIRKLN